jgi:hypothetical protein
MHKHGGDQSGIVRGLPGDPVLDNQALPDRINRRSLRQELEHAFDAGEFRGNRRGAHSESVPLGRPRGNNPQLDEVLRNYVQVAAPRGQGFQGTQHRFVLRIPNLYGSEQRAGVDEQSGPYVRSG